jgi:hypothetical protein
MQRSQLMSGPTISGGSASLIQSENVCSRVILTLAPVAPQKMQGCSSRPGRLAHATRMHDQFCDDLGSHTACCLPQQAGCFLQPLLVTPGPRQR